MKHFFTFTFLLFSFQFFLFSLVVKAEDSSFIVKKQILGEDNVGKAQKRIVIIGDGYTENQQDDFDEQVKNIIFGNINDGGSKKGLFDSDVFADYKDVFSIYTLFIPSNESGITTKYFTRNSALGIIYSGDWERCYLEEYIPLSQYHGGPDFIPTQPPTPFSNPHSTNERITEIFDRTRKQTGDKRDTENFYDYILILANYADSKSGCRRGNRIYVTNDVSGELLAHEMGHTVANLFDEYWNNNASRYTGIAINTRNCSVSPNDAGWKSLLTTGVKLPTDDSETNPQTVGAYRGCNYHADNIFRPSFTCRMRWWKDSFCKVCRNLLSSELDRLRASLPAPNQPPDQSERKSVKLIVRLNENGFSEILQADETSLTTLTNKELSSNFIFEVRKNGVTNSVGTLKEDPFVVRAFSEDSDARGEIVGRSKSSIIAINLKDVSLDDFAKNNFSIRFLQITPKKPLPLIAIDNVNQNTITEIKKNTDLTKISEIPVKEIKSITTIKPLF